MRLPDTYRDRVPIQVGADLPQVQQLCLGQEAGFGPDGVQDGSRVTLPGRWRAGSDGELMPWGGSHCTLKPGAWPSLQARVSISLHGRNQGKATSPPFILSSPEAHSQGQRAPGQVQGGTAVRPTEPKPQQAAGCPNPWFLAHEQAWTHIQALMPESERPQS